MLIRMTGEKSKLHSSFLTELTLSYDIKINNIIYFLFLYATFSKFYVKGCY